MRISNDDFSTQTKYRFSTITLHYITLHYTVHEAHIHNSHIHTRLKGMRYAYANTVKMNSLMMMIHSICFLHLHDTLDGIVFFFFFVLWVGFFFFFCFFYYQGVCVLNGNSTAAAPPPTTTKSKNQKSKYYYSLRCILLLQHRCDIIQQLIFEKFNAQI